jgi:Raf kinase inhibitor-like YbhB/YbcL family protein
MSKALIAAAIAAALLLASPVRALAAPFTLFAQGLADNELIPVEDGYDLSSSTGTKCDGKNHAPGFDWVNPPAGTQSFAIMMFDPDGRGGLGVSHWVLYNVPPTVNALNSADIAAKKYTVGRGTGDLVAYRGPCPPHGDAPHHYVITIYALDLAPSLAAGLDRDGLFKAMTGHIKGATTTVMRFQWPT